MNLSDATWRDAQETDTDLALLPVGSTEQHGPHAPLGTDHYAASAVAEAGADAYADTYGGEAVVAPTIPVGIAEEHRQFPGTLYVTEDTFRSYVRETTASLAESGLDRVVIVNGHGGNVDALRETCARLVRDGTAYAVPFTWFEAVSAAVEMGHGGAMETALMRTVRPDTVRNEYIEEAAENGADRWGEWLRGVNLAFDSAEFTDNGVVGDPREGDAELGEELLEGAAEALAELIDAVATRATGRPDQK